MTNSAEHVEKAYWVIVADESSATLYARPSRRGDLEKVLTLRNEEGRKKTGEILADRGGRSFDSFGKGRHTMAREKAGPKTHIAEQFAKQIAEQIGDIVRRGACRGYSLVAPPKFLGILRDAVYRNCKLEPMTTIDKELVGLSVDDLRRYLDAPAQRRQRRAD